MLQAFIITLREGVEAALIVGITLAYLAKIGRNDLRKSVYAALAAAFAGSIGVAVVLSRYKLNEDIFEGWVMLSRSYAALGRFDDAKGAYAHAVTLAPNDAQLLADYADAGT